MKVRISFSKGFFLLLLSSLIILFLTGCAEDSNILDNRGNRQLEFSVTTHNWSDFANSNKSSDQKVPSRATPITGTTFDTSNSFNVIADVNKGGSWSTEVDNETASYSTTNKIWQTSNTHYWPGANSTVDFYAYYPTSISGSITHTTDSAPVLSYTVPDNAADQIDILASSKTGVAGDSYNQTPVDFKHILAAVQFRVGSNGMINGTITRISLNGIQNIGSYGFTSGWTPQTSSTTTYTKNVSAASDAGTEIISGNDPFLVMPQTLLNASFTVTYSGGATLTKSLGGTWEAGKVYDYNINSSFSATQDFSYTGDVQSYTVPFTGTYKLEVWGAQGGTDSSDSITAGKGGYAQGQIKLNTGQILYIYVGGQGGPAVSSGIAGYNGGGAGSLYSYESAHSGGGGGATHIASTSGLLSTLFNNTSAIYIVAGGGGGYCHGSNNTDKHYGGMGGGINGGNSLEPYNTGLISYGATQTNGYQFGRGQDGHIANGGYFGGEGGGGCGGGWYGGTASQSTGDHTNSGGAGGTGYIGGVTNGVMQNGVRSGNGYARITFVSAN